MRRTRLGTLAASGVALLLTTATATPAMAATPGVGTSRTSTSVLNVLLGNAGSLLNLDLMSDKGAANIDPKVSSPASASSDLSPLRITSAVVPALNVTVPGLKTASTGAEQKSTAPDVALNSLGLPVVTGTLSALSLSSLVDANGAAAGITGGLKNLGLVGGLVSIPSGTLNLGAKALKSDANGFRGISIPQVDVAKLGDLLRGLGIDPANLKLDTITGLLNSLGLKLPVGGNLLDGAAVTSLVNQLTGVTGGLTSAITGATGGTAVVPLPVGDLLGGLNGVVPAIPAIGSGSLPLDTVTGALSTVNATLSGLLGSLLNLVGNTPLLSLKGLDLGLSTKAADTLPNSAAGVVAKLTSVNVGGISVPGLDVGATLAQVNGLVGGVTSTVSGVLGGIDPGLANLLSFKLFDQSKGVTTSGGYNHALAGLTGLHLGITPPAALSGIVSALNGAGTAGARAQTAQATSPGTSPIGGLISGAGGSIPLLGSGMLDLNRLLGGTLGALASGVSADLVKVQSASDFALVPTSGATPAVPAKVLPFTGQSHLVAVYALLMLAMGVGLGGWLRSTRSTV